MFLYKISLQTVYVVLQLISVARVGAGFVTFLWNCLLLESFEPRHDKTNKVSVRPAKTQISLGIRPV